MPIKQKLFNCAESGDLNGLKRIAFFSSKDEEINWNATNGGMTLLQVCINRLFQLPSSGLPSSKVKRVATEMS